MTCYFGIKCIYCKKTSMVRDDSPLVNLSARYGSLFGCGCPESNDNDRAYLEKTLTPADGEDSAGAS